MYKWTIINYLTILKKKLYNNYAANVLCITLYSKLSIFRKSSNNYFKLLSNYYQLNTRKLQKWLIF